MQLSTSGPKWGRNIQQKKQVMDIDNHGWGPATDEQVTASDDDVNDNEEWLVEIIDVSDNEDDDQDPTPPKKQKVEHASSDYRNLGTWGMATILDWVRRQLIMVASIGQKLSWIQTITQPKREIRKKHLQLWMRWWIFVIPVFSEVPVQK